MRTRLITGLILQIAGIYTAVVHGSPVIALMLVYAGFFTQYFRKIRRLFKMRTTRTGQNGSTRYIVQCKGESGWFDLTLQQYPRKTVLQYPMYKLAKKQLDTLIKTRDPIESDRLRIIKRTTSEAVV